MTQAEQAAKKRRLESMFVAPMGGVTRTPEEMKEAFDSAVKVHPFYDVADQVVEVAGDAVFCDGNGTVVGVLLRGAVPQHATKLAADVLRPAATRTSLRANIFGGEAPLSGIAGYYDYSGSPVEYKCRKTSFTCEVINTWQNVFPLVEYVSAVYKKAFPAEWKAQNDAIPDIVRINDSPFSTLTINQRFRTARHTDAGDFDAGFGILSILEGNFDGLHLSLTDFKVCFHMRPCDVLLFNTHHFHANTELERFDANADWNRLTCVFYYRSVLGEPFCLQHYQRRLDAARKLPVSERLTTLPKTVEQKDNGDNLNRPALVHPVAHTPFVAAAALLHQSDVLRKRMGKLHCLCKDPSLSKMLALGLFGEESFADVADGLPQRTVAEKIPVNLQVTIARGSALGGFSEARGAFDVASKNHTMLDDKVLAEALDNPQLLSMWREARALWLKLVDRDWTHMLMINPERDDFSWKNKSDMNAAFFDLCEVAKQVMLSLLEKDAASKREENAFWLCFAYHLYHACEKELKMVKDAMSMKKLNVKLKDFNFGGTRYLRDMPVEEQQRRAARKKRIEEARRNNANRDCDTDANANWLENDDFDYQSEATVVKYAARKWATPTENAEHLKVRHAQDVADVLKTCETESETALRVVVVVPGPALPTTETAAEEIDEVALYAEERRRMMSNGAAVRSLSGVSEDVLRIFDMDGDEVWRPRDNVSVTFVTHTDVASLLPEVDAMVLRNCLCSLADEEAVELLRLVKTKCGDGHVLVSEPVASCRSEYVLAPERRDAFRAVVRPSLRALLTNWLPRLPGSATSDVAGAVPHLRSKQKITELLAAAGCTGLALYHFPSSPRNTSVWIA